MSGEHSSAVREAVRDADFTLYVGDVRDVLPTLPAGSVDCCVTSPPYFNLRDYGMYGQIGLEASVDDYVDAVVAVFDEVHRVLKDTGTLWLNLGDSYAGSWGAQSRGNTTGEDKASIGGSSPLSARQIAAHPQFGGMTGHRGVGNGTKAKDLIGVPWQIAFALRGSGWYLRSDIIWAKPNPMPESVRDRPTKAHEYVFLLSKRPTYFYDADAIAEPATWYGPNGRPKAGPHAGQMHARARRAADNQRDDLTRNARSVWAIQTQQFADAHFAVFPEDLPRRCILAGCPPGGTVLDPFMGSGTTALVARRLGRRSVGIELNPEYADLAARRLQQLSLLAEGDAA